MKNDEEQLIAGLKSSRIKSLTTTMLKQNLLRVMKAVISGELSSVTIDGRAGSCSIVPKAKRFDENIVTGTFDIGRAMEAEVIPHRLGVNINSPRDLEIEDLPKAGSFLMLDTPALVVMQTCPGAIPAKLKAQLSKYRVCCSAMSIGEIHDLIYSNEAIKDNMRVDDYIFRLTNGLEVIAVDAAISGEAARLRNMDKFSFRDSILVATARSSYATLVTENPSMMGCKHLKSLSLWAKPE